MTTPPINATGIPWYRKEHYAEIRKLFEDGHKLPVSFDHWQNAAQRVEKRLIAEGVAVVRAFIEPVAFERWCVARRLNIDAKARIEFANWIAFQMHSKTN